MNIKKLISLYIITSVLASCAVQNDPVDENITSAETIAETSQTVTEAETTYETTAETTSETSPTVTKVETTSETTYETTTETTSETSPTVTKVETTSETTSETTTEITAETPPTVTKVETTSETTAEITSETSPTDTKVETASETTYETVTEAPVVTESKVMSQYKDASEKLDALYKEISKNKQKPAIHILTLDGKDILSKEEYNETVIDVFNCDEELRLTAEGGVKVRGNSSANDKEKPYRIKFTQKQNMLGLHDGRKYKSWVLLKSNWNLIADYMAFCLAEEIFQGEYYSSDSTFVNVYVNGEYKGLYLLCEQNQAADGRVSIYEPQKGETQTDIGYFLEIDNYAGEDPTEPFFTLDYNKVTFTDQVGTERQIVESSYTIKSDTTSKEQRDFIHKYTKGVFEIVYQAVQNKRAYKFDDNYNVVSASGTYTPEQAVEQVLDLDSVVNMLILEELVHNYDIGEGSFFMAVDFSKDSIYKKLTFLAPWDYNWGYEGNAYGNYYAGAFQEPTYDGIDRSNPWLTVLMKADWFRERVKTKWNDLQKDSSLNEVVYDVCGELVSLETELKDDEHWRIDCGADIAEFVDGRIDWLSEQWR